MTPTRHSSHSTRHRHNQRHTPRRACDQSIRSEAGTTKKEARTRSGRPRTESQSVSGQRNATQTRHCLRQQDEAVGLKMRLSNSRRLWLDERTASADRMLRSMLAKQPAVVRCSAEAARQELLVADCAYRHCAAHCCGCPVNVSHAACRQ